MFSPRFFYGYVIVIMAFLIMMVFMGLQTSFSIFFKPMTTELGWARGVTSGAFSLSQVTGGIFFILLGLIYDRFGIRVIVIICCLTTILGYLLMSQVHSVWQIYLFFGVLIGIGAAIFVPLLSTVARWFVARRSTMTGISFAGVGFGMLIFPPLINWFISLYDWRSSFFFLSAIILIISVLAVVLLKSSPDSVGQTAYGVNTEIDEDSKGIDVSFTLKEAMQTRQFWLFFCTLVCFGFCFFSIQVHIAPYVTDLGISSTGAATVMATIGGACIAGQIGLGSLGDKIGCHRAFLIGLALLAAAILTLLFARDLWAFIIFAVFLGLAFGDCGTQESPIAAWLFGLKSHGVIFGFFACSFTIGSAVGPTAFGYIFDATGSYHYAFLVSVGLAVLAVLMMLFVRRTAKTVQEGEASSAIGGNVAYPGAQNRGRR
jgi:OFA family oxalate/formate antiporter-like MFS transporter